MSKDTVRERKQENTEFNSEKESKLTHKNQNTHTHTANDMTTTQNTKHRIDAHACSYLYNQ